MFRRHHASPRLGFISVALVTGIGIATAPGCSDPEQATPKLAFESEVSSGSHKSTECGKTGTWFTIGSFGTPALGRENPDDPESPLKDPPKPVESGAAEQQGSVSISCSVIAAGDAFEVKAHAELTGATGGAVTIQGTFGKSGDQTGITVALTKRGETYTDNNCTATYDTAIGQAVAAGRVWAEVRCDNAAYSSAQQVCASRAQFRFENCAQ